MAAGKRAIAGDIRLVARELEDMRGKRAIAGDIHLVAREMEDMRGERAHIGNILLDAHMAVYVAQRSGVGLIRLETIAPESTGNPIMSVV